jgi:hypothetical protein
MLRVIVRGKFLLEINSTGYFYGKGHFPVEEEPDILALFKK